MTTEELIQKLREADPEGTNPVGLNADGYEYDVLDVKLCSYSEFDRVDLVVE